MKKIFYLSIILLGCTSINAKAGIAMIGTAKARTADIIIGLEKVPNSLGFMIFGDWGRRGASDQRQVAEQMSTATEDIGATFNLVVGDNFYPNGVKDVSDKEFKASFENVYTQKPLMDDWYVALGNHDYKSNPDAEVNYTKISSRWHMPSRYFSILKTLSDGSKAAFFIIDTSPFQTDYYDSRDYGVAVATADTAAQKKWLEEGLQKSTAKWKFVLGHHPLFSAGGRKGKTGDMLYSFGPLFEKYHVDAYFCGHEHILEFDKPKGYHFVEVISGAASECTPVTSAYYAKFVMQDLGFVAASLTPNALLFQYINEKGKILYTTEVKK